ncbi:SEC10/PgrA surface exclusion domain-containing protein [Apilactobacillus xinyiensis]|uniref:SEC10/PgrA surface exclusion domain-containing protein n=1 Tax=Apilactobacillus xinyiensis TaxID=2841032 RepID=A0ABT0I247_9LACO|nr:SEC10/PgrA surface exclusion domain-containing protein [Apilactobacillus xinyiensis]MCK8624795.1 SEC10/PgrA surface exclusion domain-containing protein [Apilactobacillus xinyiensis]
MKKHIIYGALISSLFSVSLLPLNAQAHTHKHLTKHVTITKRHHAKHKKQHVVIHTKNQHNSLPAGSMRYNDNSSFGYGSKPIATENASDTINIPTGFPFYFQDGKIVMQNNFNNAFTQMSYKINKFSPNTNDLKEKVNLNNVTKAQQYEMSKYAADLINSVRHKLSNNVSYTADLSVDDQAMNMANDIIQKYNADKWSIMSKNGHDVKAINEVAKNYGLLYSDNYSTVDDQQYYEDAATSELTTNTTMANIKQNIYEAICAMLFDDADSNWGHAENLLSSDELNEQFEHFSVAIDDLKQIHFETIPYSYTQGYQNSYDDYD